MAAIDAIKALRALGANRDRIGEALEKLAAAYAASEPESFLHDELENALAHTVSALKMAKAEADQYAAELGSEINRLAEAADEAHFEEGPAASRGEGGDR